MRFSKNWKRPGVWCMLCIILFLHVGSGYLAAELPGKRELGASVTQQQTPETGAQLSETETPLSERETQETEPLSSEMETQEPETETLPSEMETQEPETETSSSEMETQEPETEPSSSEMETAGTQTEETQTEDTEKQEMEEEETQTQAGEEAPEASEEETPEDEETQTEEAWTQESKPQDSGTEAGDEAETEKNQTEEGETDTDMETETEESESAYTELWRDGAFRRAGRMARSGAANPVVKRDNSLIFTYLEYPCYFKYVTKHGMDTGGKTVAAYCVYNTLEAPEKEPYRPTGDGAFSKEITYCLYNGCRYRGETAHRKKYSVGDWKKDYYITQVAIHIINHQQGRESSIEDALRPSKDTEVYKKIMKLVEDAYADTELVGNGTNQSKEVTFTVAPQTQAQWHQESDGTWRTAEDYVCETPYPGRILSAVKALESGTPQGISLIEKEPGNPCSAFYFRATDQAYRKIVREKLTVRAAVTVTAQEYGGWWYEPVDDSKKWQAVTYLALEPVKKGKRPVVSASAHASYFDVCILKKDDKSKKTLQGAVYGLYRDEACTGLVAQFPATGKDGRAELGQILCEQDTYYVKEITPPAGYCVNKKVYPVSSDKSRVEVTVWDQAQMAEIILKKTDSDTGKPVPQGDASLEGARYGVYARENIIHPDGSTGVLFSKGEQAAVLQTGENGTAQAGGLYPGRYYLKEITAPQGYEKDQKEYDLDLLPDGGKVPVIRREVTVKEQVKKQAFQIIKRSDQGNASPEALSGAGFTVWMISDLLHKGEQGYDTSGADPVVIGPKGETELFTDEKGYLCTIPLPYGRYLVRETTVPADHSPVKDFQVTISEHSPQEPQPWLILLDKSLMARLKIIKKDAHTGRPVLTAGAEFIVTDRRSGERIEQTTSYPEHKVHTSFFTNEEGFLILPQALPPGEYRIEEITAPEGYIRNPEPIDFEIHSDTAFQQDADNGGLIVEKECLNEPVCGKIKIKKYGERLSSCQEGAFLFERAQLPAVEFEILAAENILDSEKEIIFEKGVLVEELVTDEEGCAVSQELPLGTYLVREKQAPDGFITDQQGVEVKLQYKDQETGIVMAEIDYENVRQKIQIKVIKRDRQSDKLLFSAGFGLYAGEDIKNAKGDVIVKKDQKLAECTTDQQGEGRFSIDLPHGRYYIREERAPEGYVNEHEVREVDVTECDGVTAVIEKELLFGNTSTQIQISKTDITDGAEITGAKLEIRDEQGKIVEQWVSESRPHQIRGLEKGRTYTLTETQAPEGYLIAETITFKVEDTGEIQKVRMEDARARGKLFIEKKDKDSGKPLAGAVFELRTDTGDLVEELTTNQAGKAESQLLEIAGFENGVCKDPVSYILRESVPPDGYLLDETEYPVIFTYANGQTPVVEVHKELLNEAEPQETETESETEKTPKAPGPQSPSPKTGDDTNLAGLLMALVLSAGIAAVLIRFRTKLRGKS